MLHLNRRPGERIMISTTDGLISVTALGIDHATGKIRLGFEAPKRISIHREEIYNKNQANAGAQTLKVVSHG